MYYWEQDHGELLGDPDWGCNLIDRIFNYNGIIINPIIREDIADAINKYEPRIIITPEDITLVNDTNVLHIYLTYTIKATGQINEYNLDIYPNDNPNLV